MVELAALHLRPPTFDPAGVLSQAVQLRSAATRDALAEQQLLEARERMGALRAFRGQGGMGNVSALGALSGHPDIYTQALTTMNARDQANLLHAAREAQGVMLHPETVTANGVTTFNPARQQAYRAALDRLLRDGRITADQHAEWGAQQPTNLSLGRITSMARPLTDGPTTTELYEMFGLSGAPAAGPGGGGAVADILGSSGVSNVDLYNASRPPTAPPQAGQVAPGLGATVVTPPAGLARPPAAVSPPGAPVAPPAGQPPPAAAPARTGARPPRFAPEVDSAIAAAAAAHGLDPNLLRQIAQIESGGNPSNVTGSYRGLFQLSQSEFDNGGGGNILSPTDNANAAAANFVRIARQFRQQTGRDPTPGDLYLIHQQGMAGYGAHLAQPTGLAWQNMASTAEGRQRGEGWARQAIARNLPPQVLAALGGVDNVTSQQFMDYWRGRVGGQSSNTLIGSLNPADLTAGAPAPSTASALTSFFSPSNAASLLNRGLNSLSQPSAPPPQAAPGPQSNSGNVLSNISSLGGLISSAQAQTPPLQIASPPPTGAPLFDSALQQIQGVGTTTAPPAGSTSAAAGGQGLRALVAQATPAQRASLALLLQRRDFDNVAKLLQEIEGRAPPANYERDPNRPGSFRAIEGSAATHVPEGLAGRLAFLDTAVSRIPAIRQVYERNWSTGDFLRNMAGGANIFGGGSTSRDIPAWSGEVGQARRDIRMLVEGVLRAQTGAAAPQEEVERYESLFTPGPYDTIESARAKINALQEFVQRYRALALSGRSSDPGSLTVSPPAAATSPPPAAAGGAGYRVLGVR